MSTFTEGAQPKFSVHGHNPDVLTCIANLSNDEVFTPPELANQMLDMIEQAWAEDHDGASIWADSTVTFLDPVAKSGVFLREITRRLTEGLAEEIPDLQERVDHILTKQVYGIGITTLTSLLARRSLYCSKDATGKHSIAKSFDRDWGNVWFERTEHTWVGDRCGYCGARKVQYDRDGLLETHAYAFIHAKDIRARLARMFGADVQFDVIIGNPPYQLSDESSDSSTRTASASPIYHEFIAQAKNLEPRYLTMVIPSRWMAGGRGLQAFRTEMLGDRAIRALVDYPDVADAFGQGVRVSGGVCYFLRDEGYTGPTQVTTVWRDHVKGPISRLLDEHDVFVRDGDAVEILEKVTTQGHGSVEDMFQSGFGLDTNFSGAHDVYRDGDLIVHMNVGGMGHKRATRFLSRANVPRGAELIDEWKVLVPSAAGYGSEQRLDRVLGKPIVAGPGEIGTQTYRVIGPFTSEIEARNFESYYSTKLFRFLVQLRKATQHASPSVYRWVPVQDWSRRWNDSDVFSRYAITPDEQAYIDTRVRAVDWASGGNDV